MIKCDLAKVGWSGPKIILQTEVATLLHSMIKNGVFTPEEIDEIVVDAKKTAEEMAAEVDALAKKASPEHVAFVDMATDLMRLLMDLDD